MIISVHDRYLRRVQERQHTLCVNLPNRSKIVLGILAFFAVLGGWLGVAQYHSHLVCVARHAAFHDRVEKLRTDAGQQLRIGVNKSELTRFFEEHGMRVNFGYGLASGSIQTTGCAPFGCGADTAVIGVSVPVDDQGTVTAEPRVSGIYTDCL